MAEHQGVKDERKKGDVTNESNRRQAKRNKHCTGRTAEKKNPSIHISKRQTNQVLNGSQVTMQHVKQKQKSYRLKGFLLRREQAMAK